MRRSWESSLGGRNNYVGLVVESNTSLLPTVSCRFHAASQCANRAFSTAGANPTICRFVAGPCVSLDYLRRSAGTSPPCDTSGIP
jgi:hypothetical protein